MWGEREKEESEITSQVHDLSHCNNQIVMYWGLKKKFADWMKNVRGSIWHALNDVVIYIQIIIFETYHQSFI